MNLKLTVILFAVNSFFNRGTICHGTSTETYPIHGLECPHGYNWKEDGITGHCYWETSYETNFLSWTDARAYCQSYGGDLASFHNIQEEMIGLSFQYGSMLHEYWIGLIYNASLGSYTWADGSPLDYVNWGPNEPQSPGPHSKCAQMDATMKHWITAYCGQLGWFVCKAPKQYSPRIPAPPTPEPMIECEDREGLSFRGHCYKVHMDHFSWSLAAASCGYDGAHLVSVYDEDELDFLLRALHARKGSVSNKVWLGLTKKDGDFRWTDNTPLHFLVWSTNQSAVWEQPDGICVSMLNDKGTWVVEDCHDSLPFICKWTSNTFTTRQTTATPNLYCRNGWYTIRDHCYAGFGFQEADQETWHDAQKKCQHLKGYLATIGNAEDQMFLSYLLQLLKSDAWIGLKHYDSRNAYYWSNSISPFTYRRFAPGAHPLTAGSKDCMYMEYNSTDSGHWKDTTCTKKKAYICQSEKDSEKYNDAMQKDSRCIFPQGWLKNGMFCYKIFFNNATYRDASLTCATYNSRLVSITDFSSEAVLRYLTYGSSETFWIGLQAVDGHKFQWINGWPVTEFFWGPLEPNAEKYNESCFARNSAGDWITSDCEEKKHFICQASSGIPPKVVQKTFSGDCPSDKWIDTRDDNCYLLSSKTTRDWAAAEYKCLFEGAHLISFHSMEQINSLKKYLVAGPYFIGLSYTSEGYLRWTDDSALDFVNWDTRLVNITSTPSFESRLCFQISSSKSKWYSVTCEQQGYYICSVKKENITTSGDILNRSSLEIANAQIGIATGAIAAIVFSILIVGVVLAFGFLLFVKPKWARVFRLQSKTAKAVAFENVLYNCDIGSSIQKEEVILDTGKNDC